MELRQNVSDIREDLVSLRSGSLRLVVPLIGAIAYIWIAVLMWPVTASKATEYDWLGALILVGAATVSYLCISHHVQFAAFLLIGGCLVSISCIVLSIGMTELVYCFIVPIVLTSLFLGQITTFLVTTLVCFYVLLVGTQYNGMPLLSLDVILPIGIIMFVTVASWLSARHLHVALAWALNGYEQARRNEQMARDRQGDLRRSLRALDEASYRLERTNYMLQLARDQAEDARILKQRFAQTISHELRTPLSVIVGFVELMVQSPEYYGSSLSSPYLRDLSIVHRNASHLQSLVNDVLDLARIESAQIGLQPQATDVGALVADAANTARSLVESRGLDLHIDIEPHLPRLWLDPTRIRQVLFNLMNNAARFTEQGSVSISVKRRDEDVLINVSDTGVGIAEEEIPLLFEEFHQVDSTSRRRHDGAGLGLAISRRFVEMHRGRIWAESQVGEGSTFSFVLPVDVLEKQSMSITRSNPTVRQHSTQWRRERTLLVVTPSPAAAALITRHVKGCRVVIVHDLSRAPLVAQQLMPQVVVIDAACLTMETDSLDALTETWALPDTIFVACPLPGEDLLRQRLSADGCLVKPISRESLWDVLRQFGQSIDRVLVVDDDYDFARMLTRMLDSSTRWYDIVVAHSGREALDMFQIHQPDVVLLDLVLPDMNGTEVLRRLRQNTLGKSLPIIVISAQGEVDPSEALRGTVHIAKAGGVMPVETTQLIQVVLDMSTRLGACEETTSGHKAAEG